MTNLFSQNKPAHFLDYASPKFRSHLIEDSKSVLSCFLLLIPIPLFWSLFDQQGSNWVLQAEQLDGEVRLFKGWSFTLRSDQFQVFNPLIVVALIPFFDYVIYPIFDKIKFCTKPLQRVSH